MNAITSLNIESELSYVYLHAVASRAGMACKAGNRHEDDNGIDAIVTAWGPFSGGGYLTEVDLKIQLKATIRKPSDDGTNLSYSLRGVTRYNDLRNDRMLIPRILVVLFLPEDAESWLEHTPDQLILRRCAYWQSLRGAPDATKDSVTVKLPKSQMFTPQALEGIMERLSHRDFPTYPTT